MKLLFRLANALSAFACIASTAPAADGPSHVENPRTEESLTTVTLSQKAEQRLAIHVEPVEMRSVPVYRSYPADVIYPIQNGLPALTSYTPDALLEYKRKQIEADSNLKIATQKLAFAQKQFDQTNAQLSRKLVSQLEVDALESSLAEAQIALQTVTQIRELLGEPLETKRSTSNVYWIKSSIFVGDIERLDLASIAKLMPINSVTDGIDAKPIPQLRTANAQNASLDVYYQLPASTAFTPGQRAQVDIPLKMESESLVIPWSAVLYDIYGGQWVYERTAPQTYVRRSVQVQRVVDDLAVLAKGPPAGSDIVTEAAAELMGTEFGVGH